MSLARQRESRSIPSPRSLASRWPCPRSDPAFAGLVSPTADPSSSCLPSTARTIGPSHSTNCPRTSTLPRSVSVPSFSPPLSPSLFSHSSPHFPPRLSFFQTFTSKLLSQLSSRLSPTTTPFLAYLAYTAPHWPLQAPPSYIAKYKGRYDAGPAALRIERLAKLEELGLVEKGVTPHPLVGVLADEGGWEKMSEEERKVSSRGMEIYSAMVEFMDEQIGRVFAYLEETGECVGTD